MKLRRLGFLLLIIAFGTLILCALFFKSFVNQPLLASKQQVFYVPPHSSIYSIADTLHAKGVLPYPKLFILLAALEGKGKKLKAGEYLLTPGMTPHQLVKKLAAGKIYLRRFTIIEGWTQKQVFTSMNANPYLAHTINNPAADSIFKKLNVPNDNIEGMLYPDTYLFAKGVPDSIILKKAFVSMQQKLKEHWQQRDAGLPYNDPYSALIVASLIEKETANPAERAKIAGVIIRRLQQKMLLQIDASVIYGLGSSYSGKITRADLKIDTPYNTYLHAGLPPTPIAMPSLPSLLAALHPEAGTSLYYVARGDGSHEFTDSLQAHNEAVRKYHVTHLQTATINPQSIIPWTSPVNPDLHPVWDYIQPIEEVH